MKRLLSSRVQWYFRLKNMYYNQLVKLCNISLLERGYLDLNSGVMTDEGDEVEI